MRGGKVAVWLGLVLLCLFSSCSKDEELFPVSKKPSLKSFMVIWSTILMPITTRTIPQSTTR